MHLTIGEHMQVQANHCLMFLSYFLNWCEKQEYRTLGTNPVRLIRKFKTKGRETQCRHCCCQRGKRTALPTRTRHQKAGQAGDKNDQKVLLESLKNQLTEKTNMLTEAQKEQAQLMDEKQKLKDEKEAFEIDKRKQLEKEKILYEKVGEPRNANQENPNEYYRGLWRH
jgi:hypothetical protein